MNKTIQSCLEVFTCLLIFLSQTVSAFEGEVSQKSIMGPISKHKIHFDIYLPKDYKSGSKKYPVIYFLHGKGRGSKTPKPETDLFKFYDDAINSGKLPPLIVVAPNSRATNMWGDAKDKSSMAETYVIKELIPHIDSEYRTISDRKGRIIEGFSMGGFGAAMFGSKFPELFCGTICLDGAMHTWDTLKKKYADSIASKVFELDGDHFNKYSPHHQVGANVKNINKYSMEFLIMVGRLKEYNIKFKDVLDKNKIPYKYINTPMAHTPKVREHDLDSYCDFIKRKLSGK